MRPPLNIQEQDRPITITHEAGTELPFVIHDVNGTLRARFVVQEDAQAYGDAVNFPEPELMQKDMRDTGVERDQADRVQPKEETMPRGIPNKKKAKKAVKKVAAVAKKAAKKFAKKAAKRRKQRA
jgi:hypothetical protein